MLLPRMFGISCSKTSFTRSPFCASVSEPPTAMAVSANAKALVRITLLIGYPRAEKSGVVRRVRATHVPGSLRSLTLVHLVAFARHLGLGRLGDLRELLLKLASSDSPFMGEWK